MATIFAPRSLRARIAWVMTLTCVATAFVPQMTTQSDFAISRGSAPHELAGPGDISGPRDANADCPVEAGIALGVREALDSVAHHETHRARVKVWPHAFGSELALDRKEIVSDAVERLVPRDRFELPASPWDRRGETAG